MVFSLKNSVVRFTRSRYQIINHRFLLLEQVLVMPQCKGTLSNKGEIQFRELRRNFYCLNLVFT